MLNFTSYSKYSSVFPHNHLDSVRIYIIHFLTPFLITLNFYLLRFTSSLLCSLSPILFRTNSLLLIIHLSFYINHFALFPSPPTTYCSNTFLSSSRLSSKIFLSSTLSLRESLVILQAVCYWLLSKAKARWICQCLLSDYITLLLQ